MMQKIASELKTGFFFSHYFNKKLAKPKYNTNMRHNAFSSVVPY